jgi:NADP-dependent 3-hydroxy acid dehydrogenase YdfG
MPTLAIFGAGPALGLSVARRFAAGGHDIALIARDPAKLARLADALGSAQAVETFTADLTDRAQIRDALAGVRARFGLPDVVVYAPGDVSRLPVAALDLSPEALETWLPLHLLSPLALGEALLSDMIARGSGALLVVQGIAAREPDPMLASVGAAQAALRNWLHAAAAQAGPHGVRVRGLLIGALIERSAAATLFDQGRFAGVEAGALPRVDPDDLAERAWTLAFAGRTPELAIP